MENKSVARNAIYLYIQTIVAAGSGYIFWLIISRLTGPEIVGIASTSMAIAGMAISFATLGVPKGFQRFLGRARVESDPKEFKKYLNASLLIVGLAVAATATMLAIMGRMLAIILNLSITWISKRDNRLWHCDVMLRINPDP